MCFLAVNTEVLVSLIAAVRAAEFLPPIARHRGLFLVPCWHRIFLAFFYLLLPDSARIDLFASFHLILLLATLGRKGTVEYINAGSLLCPAAALLFWTHRISEFFMKKQFLST